jgi:hypothetical protein
MKAVGICCLCQKWMQKMIGSTGLGGWRERGHLVHPGLAWVWDASRLADGSHRPCSCPVPCSLLANVGSQYPSHPS